MNNHTQRNRLFILSIIRNNSTHRNSIDINTGTYVTYHIAGHIGLMFFPSLDFKFDT